MKTLQELYAEVMNSEELKNEFLTLKTPEDIVAFAAKYGCTTTQEELQKFFEEKARVSGELSEDELTQVVGGKSALFNEGFLSTMTAGIACAIGALVSVATGRCGTAIKGKGMLCVEVTEDGREFNSME